MSDVLYLSDVPEFAATPPSAPDNANFISSICFPSLSLSLFLEPVCVGSGQHRAALRQTGPGRDQKPAHVLSAHPQEHVRG